MSQHSFSIANEVGSAFRADVNSALQALASCSRGAAAPGTTYAGQVWDDSTANVQKKRNAANAAWIVKATLDESFVLSRSSNTILGLSDFGKCIVATAGFTQTLTAAATLGDGWYVDYRIDGAITTVVFDPNSSENIDGATTKSVVGPASGRIYCNGSAFFSIGLDIRPTLSAEVATTSGTTVEITGIPAWARRITLNLVGVSTSGGSGIPVIQVGTSSAYKTSGYNCGVINATASCAAGTSTTGFQFSANSVAAAAYHGSVTLTLEDGSDNTWTVQGGVVDMTTPGFVAIAGSFALAAALDRIRINSTSVDTFDAGVMSVLYQ